MRGAHGARDGFLLKMFRRMRAIRRRGKDAFAQLGLDLGACQKHTRAAGNVLRASSLFYVETGLVPQASPWWHDGIGIAAFMLSAAVTLWLLGRLRDWRAAPCPR